MKKLLLAILCIGFSFFQLNAQCSFSVSETHTNVSCNGGSNGTIDLSLTPPDMKGLLISEIFTNPSGNDSPFEFVELVATERIDFSVTPYTVIWATNGVANPQGWMEGNVLSYAFEITTGVANTGDVIYVGGSSMTPTTNVFRSINTATTTGDGFVGNANVGGVLGNGGSDADGVAVFNQPISNLNGNTVPIDALFFGTGVGNAFVNTTQGYQLPVNDSYGGGKLQANSFFAANPNQDEYLKATGTYNVELNAFTTPRTWTTTTSFTNLTTSISLASTYSFLWSNAATTEDLSGLTAGTYSYTVSDGSCSVNGTVTITQPTAITASFSNTNVSCNGGTNGITTIIPTGGTPGYTYNWAPSGITAPSQFNLPAGCYTCTVTDANGCVSIQPTCITEPNVLAIGFSTTPPSCNGGTNGSATAIPTGGTGPFTYSWSPSAQTSATATSLVSQTYSVTVVDANGCTATNTILLTQPTPVNAFLSGTTIPSCNGENNGTAVVGVSGGTPGYSYVWSPAGGNAATGTGLSAGTYTCVVIDANGCGQSVTATITQPSALSITSSSTSVSCNGGNNGTASVSVAGGTPGYSYNWSSGGNAATETGLSAGTYTCTITDANGCIVTQPVTVTQPNVLMAGLNSFSNVTCNGGNNGSATVNVIGGTLPYSYAWNPIGGNTATGTNLTAGTFTCTITDANGCTTTQTVTLTQPPAIVITTSTTNATCGFNDGTATASATGGNPGYSYLWSSGGNTSTVIGLFAGFYTVTVTDASGCINTQQVSVLNPNAPVITPFLTNVSCFGSTNGSAAVVASGGNPGYTYLWSTGATIPNLNSVGAGTYTISVTDQSSCVGFTSITITQPPQIVSTFSVTAVSCNGGNNGSATASVTGGTPNYSYSWSSGGTSTTENNLAAGTYTFTVTDANSCVVATTVAVTQPTPITISTSNVDVTCPANNNGSSTVTPSGGTPGYTYSWSSGGTAATENNLPAGIYTVTVTDVNNCAFSFNDTINSPPAFTLTPSSTGIICSYDSTGTATVVPNGGTAPFAYAWSTGGTAATETGLTGGTYSVTVTDANSCYSNATVTVNSPAPITITSVITNNTCYGGNAGAVTITASGGTPGYTYHWSNGSSATTQTGLTSGTYTLTIVDANDCQFIFPITITEPTPVSIATTITDASCNGGTNGGAAIVASGGTPGYSYLWSTGSTSTSISNVAAGIYFVTVTDANSCPTTFTVYVTNPNAPVVSITSTTESCNGGHTGAGVSTITGGNPGYTYAWTPTGGTNQNAFNLTAGNYTLTVTDQSGCQGFGLAVVTEPAAGWLNALGPDTTICLPATSYTLCAPSIYSSFLWNTGNTTHCLTAFSTGCYDVKVTDGNGCISRDTACLVFTSCVGIQPEEISSFEIFPNPASSQINISLGSAIPNAELEIYDARGKLMEKKIIFEKETVDVSGYAKGLYFVRVNGEVKKIVVE